LFVKKNIGCLAQLFYAPHNNNKNRPSIAAFPLDWWNININWAQKSLLDSVFLMFTFFDQCLKLNPGASPAELGASLDSSLDSGKKELFIQRTKIATDSNKGP